MEKLYICGKNSEIVGDKFNLFKLDSNEYFTQLENVHIQFIVKEDYSKIVALSDKQVVYEVNGNELKQSEYKSIEEYSVMKYGATYKTYTRFKDSYLNLTELIGNGQFGRVYKVFFQTQYYAIKKILIEENSNLDSNSELKNYETIEK